MELADGMTSTISPLVTFILLIFFSQILTPAITADDASTETSG